MPVGSVPRRPLGLSCGDPSGIGPEIAAKAWHALRDELPFFFIGDPEHLPEGTPLAEIASAAEAAEVMKQALPVLPMRFPAPALPGAPDPENAQPIIDAIAWGVELARRGEASALTTAPINKHALKSGAGFAFPGHTEYLADLCGVARVVMMLAGPNLRVVPATIHIPLAEVPRALTRDLLEEVLCITHAGLKRDLGLTSPRIAVTGLNPHAGESGMMGTEDAEIIAAVIQKLAAQSMRVTGPHPADTLFHEAARARYDVAVCMYHDQALIPIKTLDFDKGVNVTLGLPIIRTSPDHGTAYDIAGKGRANPTSLIEALRLADDMARTRATAAR